MIFWKSLHKIQIAKGNAGQVNQAIPWRLYQKLGVLFSIGWFIHNLNKEGSEILNKKSHGPIIKRFTKSEIAKKIIYLLFFQKLKKPKKNAVISIDKKGRIPFERNKTERPIPRITLDRKGRLK